MPSNFVKIQSPSLEWKAPMLSSLVMTEEASLFPCHDSVIMQSLLFASKMRQIIKSEVNLMSQQNETYFKAAPGDYYHNDWLVFHEG